MGSTPTDCYAVLRYNMVKAHNVIKLGFDNILEHLENPPTAMADVNDFLGYCQAWAGALEGHHDVEEVVVFPLLNQKLDFSGEQEQHRGIHEFLERFLQYIQAARTDPVQFNVEKLKSMMKEVHESLTQHFDEEVLHIAPETLKVFSEDAIKKMNNDMLNYVKSHGNPFINVPFMRSHTPPEFKDTWPELPWVLRKVIVPYVLAPWYSGYWKYSPYGMS